MIYTFHFVAKYFAIILNYRNSKMIIYKRRTSASYLPFQQLIIPILEKKFKPIKQKYFDLMNYSTINWNNMDGTYVSPNDTFVDRLQIGLLYVFSSLFFFTLQLSICIIFVLYKEYRQNICYRIMTISSFIDCLQLVVHAYGGIIVIFNDSFSSKLHKFLGSLLESSVTISFSIALILALNRLIIFLPKSCKFLTKHRERQLFNLLLLFCLLFGLIIQLLFCFSPATLRFNYYTWTYSFFGNDTRNWSWVYKFDVYEPMPVLFITFCIYLAIFVLLIYQRKMMTSSDDQSNVAGFSKNELILLAQAFPQFIMELALNIFWNFYRIRNNVFLNCQWIFYNGYKPLIYLILNKPIRRKLFNLWFCRTNKSVDHNVTAIRMIQMKNVYLQSNQLFEKRTMTMTKVHQKSNCGSGTGNMMTIC